MRKLWTSYRDVGVIPSPPRKKSKPINDIDKIIDANTGQNETLLTANKYNRWLAIKPLPKDHKFLIYPFLY